MLRIYFDWNAMAQLRNPTSEPYISIAKKLEENKDFVMLLYSPAHISDLNKNFGQSGENDKLTYEDLDFISSFTNDTIIAQYWGEESIKIHGHDPREYFEKHKDDMKESLRDMMNLEKLFEDTDPEIKVLIDQFKSMTFPSDYELMPQSELEKFNFKYPMPTKGQPVYQYLLEVADYVESIMKDPTVYGNLRDIIQNGLSIETKRTANWKDVFGEFDKMLPNTPFGKTLTEHIETNAEKKSSKNLFYNEFLLAYSTLDTFGYKSDSLSAKNTHENISNDGKHSFYASHCDLFITNDKKLKSKSEALFTKYELLTQLITPSDLAIYLDSCFSLPDSIPSFVTHINSLIIQSNKHKTFTVNEATENIPRVETHYFKGLVLKYFNACHLVLYNDGVISYQLHDTRKRVTYNQIEFITNYLVKLLRFDINGLGEYNAKVDKKMIDEKKWEGREWRYEGFSLKAHIVENSSFVIGMSFKIVPEQNIE